MHVSLASRCVSSAESIRVHLSNCPASRVQTLFSERVTKGLGHKEQPVYRQGEEVAWD